MIVAAIAIAIAVAGRPCGSATLPALRRRRCAVPSGRRCCGLTARFGSPLFELRQARIVGIDPDAVAEAAEEALARDWEPAEIPLWDGAAGERIAAVMSAWVAGGKGGEPGICGAGISG